MLVTCIMPTSGRRRFIPQALEMFLAQDFVDKELLVLDDGADSVEDLIPDHQQIRYLLCERRTLGEKRNLACESAHGEIILHWDDDDWYAPWRLRYQVEALERENLDVCGVDRAFFVKPETLEAWEYVFPQRAGRRWVCGATLCYRKSFWSENRFPAMNKGEDTRFIFQSRTAKVGALGDNRFFVGRIHPYNTCPKATQDRRWERRPVELVRSFVGRDWDRTFGGAALHASANKTHGAALVSAGAGIGDILRVTPLIRAAHQLGYTTDVLLSPDDPAASELLRGAPEIRNLFTAGPPRPGRSPSRSLHLEDIHYDIATFTYWSRHLSGSVNARQAFTFDARWRAEGDVASATRIAQELGWDGDLPAPFAMMSERWFDLPEGTVAIHPGCKRGWPWKKWHGFDELASLFENVAIVGTEQDLDTTGTYFARSFRWPPGVMNFVGQLDLRDTAALLSQCAGLVSLDSGLMHLGVAVGIPTFGIFGITSPQRECIPSPFMVPITKQMPCEPACHTAMPGRRDCALHRACLRELTAPEVAVRVQRSLSSLPEAKSSSRAISVNYHSEVFAASGFGQAARLYIRALNAVGVRVNVVNTGGRRQLEDPFIESLVGHDAKADFNIFHGVPTAFGRAAARLSNIVAITVWEATPVPYRWRTALSRAVDVWVPCEQNVSAFGHIANAFRVPHVVPPEPEPGLTESARVLDGIGPGDFVFYSIFHWQERKNARGLIKAFLLAFPATPDAVLLVKTSDRAAPEATELLRTLREETSSPARVTLVCESLGDREIRELHARGDCYVSLHRGEGWGYPLFEAASLGKPVVATAHGGPLDYLDSGRHHLVPCSMTRVQKPYYLFSSAMEWAEPDLARACEALRDVYANRDRARAAAEDAARELRRAFSAEAIGALAKARLLELKRQMERPREQRVEPAISLAPKSLPISGDWYDENYFERGLKSNWRNGYSWRTFAGVFEEAAAFLEQSFPAARSYLDAGCAKGFLVHSLRERGLDAFGFDHSAWAIENAFPAAKPYVSLASVDAARYEDVSFDIVTMMSLLESLTEPQIADFLLRARRWARHGLLAIIAKPNCGIDRDLSHVTMRERRWWVDRFLEAGWEPDPQDDRIALHSLSVKMGWETYAFRAGS